MRLHNFSAGPAVLPVSVVEELQANLLEFEGCGLGLMEMSHRGDTFEAIIASAFSRTRRVLALPADHQVLFLQGGASMQFLMVPQNLLQGGSASYLETGTWSTKAIKEARRFGEVRVPFSGKEQGFRSVPQGYSSSGYSSSGYSSSGDTSSNECYLHYTSNNTVVGTQFHEHPTTDGLLVCDMSSDIASRPIDGGAWDLIYAGAQKNLGPSGVTVVALSPRAMERAASAGAPTMLDYGVHARGGSMFNTPNTLGIYVLERVLAWVEAQGLAAVAATNTRKADALYDLFDASDFWRPHAASDSRSQMNVTWRLADVSLEKPLLSAAESAGFSGIKGHRSVGGLRASIYNACPEESVLALADFLREFERTHG